mmetsp:Transcript_44170/g.122828  ORF Transcript_44170/g.122828 Transcript_44170/m.122828 type:complete len:228 (+) Transcript_44170:242-925(+)
MPCTPRCSGRCPSAEALSCSGPCTSPSRRSSCSTGSPGLCSSPSSRSSRPSPSTSPPPSSAPCPGCGRTLPECACQVSCTSTGGRPHPLGPGPARTLTCMPPIQAPSRSTAIQGPCSTALHCSSPRAASTSSQPRQPSGLSSPAAAAPLVFWAPRARTSRAPGLHRLGQDPRRTTACTTPSRSSSQSTGSPGWHSTSTACSPCLWARTASAPLRLPAPQAQRQAPLA